MNNGVGLTILPCKKTVEKPPRNSAIFNGRRLRRKPKSKLGCGAKKKKKKNINNDLDPRGRSSLRLEKTA
jgi:hypothetical protein